MRDKPLSVQIIAPGGNLPYPKAGDFFLVHRTKIFSRLIQFGQRRRFTKEEAFWNHCGLFIDNQGHIAEALVKGGICQGHISKYKDVEYIIVRVHASDEDRLQMVKFADWATGKPYGILTDISIAVWCIIGGKFDVSIDGEFICSGFVARALERAGYIFDRDPSRETPADLARHFSVHRDS